MGEKLQRGDDDFSREPWDYPGDILKESRVLHRGCLRPIEPRPKRRLGKAWVDEDDEFPRASLNEFLLLANVANVDQRTLVVAVGSNASPIVIHRKLIRKE
jgi:hypothetical protein